MTRPPDRLLSTVNAGRTRTAIGTLAPGGNLGQTRRARAVAVRGALRVAQALGIFAIVMHGDDGTVARPAVMLVLWVGGATPANGADYDFWYPATI